MRLVKFTRDIEAVWINPEMVTRVEATTQVSAITTIYLRDGGIVHVRESVQVVVEALTNIVRI